MKLLSTLLAYCIIASSEASDDGLDDLEHEVFVQGKRVTINEYIEDWKAREDIDQVEIDAFVNATLGIQENGSVESDMKIWMERQRKRRSVINYKWTSTGSCGSGYENDKPNNCQNACMKIDAKYSWRLTSTYVRRQNSNYYPSGCSIYIVSNRWYYCYYNANGGSSRTCRHPYYCACQSIVTKPPSEQPTPAPTSFPTAYPTMHACDAGNHGCDKTEFGICNKVDPAGNNGKDWSCSCKPTHQCKPNCKAVGHTCEWITKAPTTSDPTAVPTSVPTTSTPSVSPTTSPTKGPTSSVPTAVPTVIPTISFPSQSPTPGPTPNPTPAPVISTTIASSENNSFMSSGQNSYYVAAGVVILFFLIIVIALVIFFVRMPSNKDSGDGRDKVSFANPSYEEGVTKVNPLANDGLYDDPDQNKGDGYLDVDADE